MVSVSDKALACYLDIETTGLDPSINIVTVLGMLIAGPRGDSLIQLYGDSLTRDNLLSWLNGVSHIYTYNGSQFDLPFINAKYHLSLPDGFVHTDLMFECWARGLYGGYKAVQDRLGIKRIMPNVDGLVAIELWKKYSDSGDRSALSDLLRYNRGDCYNLRELKNKLRMTD